MNPKKTDTQVASLEEVWHGMQHDMRNAPRGLFKLIFSLDTYLILTVFVGIPTIYYGGTALLFNYLPARLFRAKEGSVVGDLALALMLFFVLGIYFWSKLRMPLNRRESTRKQYSERGWGKGCV